MTSKTNSDIASKQHAIKTLARIIGSDRPKSPIYAFAVSSKVTPNGVFMRRYRFFVPYMNSWNPEGSPSDMPEIWDATVVVARALYIRLMKDGTIQTSGYGGDIVGEISSVLYGDRKVLECRNL